MLYIYIFKDKYGSSIIKWHVWLQLQVTVKGWLDSAASAPHLGEVTPCHGGCYKPGSWRLDVLEITLWMFSVASSNAHANPKNSVVFRPLGLCVWLWIRSGSLTVSAQNGMAHPTNLWSIILGVPEKDVTAITWCFRRNQTPSASTLKWSHILTQACDGSGCFDKRSVFHTAIVVSLYSLPDDPGVEVSNIYMRYGSLFTYLLVKWSEKHSYGTYVFHNVSRTWVYAVCSFIYKDMFYKNRYIYVPPLCSIYIYI